MADQLLEQVRELAEGQIDFKGQQLAEYLATALLGIVGAIAFLVGYVRQDIKLALVLGLVGTAFTFLVIVFPWPMFKRHPVKWLPVQRSGPAPASHGIVVDGLVVN